MIDLADKRERAKTEIRKLNLLTPTPPMSLTPKKSVTPSEPSTPTITDSGSAELADQLRSLINQHKETNKLVKKYTIMDGLLLRVHECVSWKIVFGAPPHTIG